VVAAHTFPAISTADKTRRRGPGCAAVLHDYLWSDAVPAGLLTRADVDGIFRRATRELKVPFLRRWIISTDLDTGSRQPLA
jgi:hypothetical protein